MTTFVLPVNLYAIVLWFLQLSGCCKHVRKCPILWRKVTILQLKLSQLSSTRQASSNRSQLMCVGNLAESS
ncbi:hypothetical protein ACQKWADRAFT_298429 [Trichoderma austrokoningii]